MNRDREQQANGPLRQWIGILLFDVMEEIDGIDMALHVVGRLAGPQRARQVREGIEYAPEPPH
jgi:hypothetical protein